MLQTDAVATAYAQAFLEAGQAAGQINDLRETSEGLLEVWLREPRLKAVLAHPGISLEKKHQLNQKCFGQIEEELMRNLLGVLINKGRIGHLASILQTFLDLVDAAEGIEGAQVTTATALDEESRQQLIEALSKRFDKQIFLKEQVKLDLMGGVQVRLGDTVFDGSTRTHLNRLASTFENFHLDRRSIWEE